MRAQRRALSIDRLRYASGKMMARPLFAAVLFGAAFAASGADAPDPPQYAVRFDASSQRADVRLCLAGQHARVHFAADSAWAMRFVDDVQREHGIATAADGGWNADDWQRGECLRYRADLGAIARERKPDVGWQIGGDFIAAPQLWLLRPDVQGDTNAQVCVQLPDGWSISAPWRERAPPRDDARARRFEIPNTPANWSAAVAFGTFREQRIELPGGVLRVGMIGAPSAAEQAKLRTWLERLGHAALGAYGRLPLPDVQVLTIPVGGRRAVTFGQSIRGEGNALELLIDPSAPVAEFDDDWTAVHELSHLMHPYLGDRGAWLSEGLATYYQNVLRARAGLLTPAQARDRLREGFRRGARAQDDATLEEIASGMHRSHAFQRVYWAGAAYWLTVDRDLRRASRGAMNLETALARFRDCCLPAYRGWKPEDFVARLDALAGTAVFSARYREFAAMRQFPDWQKVYEDLGIRDGNGPLAFAADARDAAIREAIMKAPAVPTAVAR
jgi:hypothetical protein